MDPTGESFHHAPLSAPPRSTGERTRRHSLHDILVIALCGVICGADDWVAIERFGKAKVVSFRSFLELPHGIPSHDTFGRVFAALNPEAFKTAFLAWVCTLAAVMPGEVVAIDGKTLRQTFDTAANKAAVHMVSAWGLGAGPVLGPDQDGRQVQRDHGNPHAAGHPGAGPG